MISNEVYNKLKRIKEKRNESFSNVLNSMIEDRPNKAYEALGKVVAVLKGDKEYDEIRKDMEKRWKEWGKRYA